MLGEHMLALADGPVQNSLSPFLSFCRSAGSQPARVSPPMRAHMLPWLSSRCVVHVAGRKVIFMASHVREQGGRRDQQPGPAGHTQSPSKQFDEDQAINIRSVSSPPPSALLRCSDGLRVAAHALQQAQSRLLPMMRSGNYKPDVWVRDPIKSLILTVCGSWKPEDVAKMLTFVNLRHVSENDGWCHAGHGRHPPDQVQRIHDRL